jgi:4'-phosphopantetheinyl transferase
VFYWLEQRENDVPPGDAWLSCCERERSESMHVPKRRSDWLLGRWTAKLALASFYQLPAQPEVLAEIEIRAEDSGAPVLFHRGEKSDLAISLSHSSGTAFVTIAPPGKSLGCDLERIEPRSPAFIEDYCTESELHLIDAVAAEDRPLLVNLIWSAKESVLKLLGIGLRGDTRCISVSIDTRSLAMGTGQWLAFKARSTDAQTFCGLWCNSSCFVRTVAAEKQISHAVELTIPRVSKMNAERKLTG